MRSLQRLAPVLILLAGLLAAWALGLQRLVTWDALAAHQAALLGLVADHPLLAPLAYVGVYVLIVALSLPGGVVMTVSGGLLFGTLAGTVLAVIGAAVGASLLFLAARHAFAEPLSRRASGLLARVRPGLQRDGFSYLLALRLIPVVPFWLVNLAPALVGMRFAPYAAATLLGILPGTLVFASIGAGVGGVLAAGRHPDLSVVFTPRVLLPLLGLALLSLAPVIWRRATAGRRATVGDA